MVMGILQNPNLLLNSAYGHKIWVFELTMAISANEISSFGSHAIRVNLVTRFRAYVTTLPLTIWPPPINTKYHLLNFGDY